MRFVPGVVGGKGHVSPPALLGDSAARDRRPRPRQRSMRTHTQALAARIGDENRGRHTSGRWSSSTQSDGTLWSNSLSANRPRWSCETAN
jgi:hypothetical protein